MIKYVLLQWINLQHKNVGHTCEVERKATSRKGHQYINVHQHNGMLTICSDHHTREW